MAVEAIVVVVATRTTATLPLLCPFDVSSFFSVYCPFPCVPCVSVRFHVSMSRYLLLCLSPFVPPINLHLRSFPPRCSVCVYDKTRKQIVEVATLPFRKNSARTHLRAGWTCLSLRVDLWTIRGRWRCASADRFSLVLVLHHTDRSTCECTLSRSAFFGPELQESFSSHC